MRIYILLVALTVSNFTSYSWAQNGTWTSTDALGRKLPTPEQVGPQRPDKIVGIFYWTWHGKSLAKDEPVNNQLTLQLYPEAANDYNHPAWKQLPLKPHNHHWNAPLFGYYRTTDPWVLRRHAQMLADAGVDLIVFDATNGSFTWKESYDVLFEVFDQARRDGVRVPRFAFMLGFGPWPQAREALQKIYDDIYKPGRYKDLWFLWKGKPLVMAYSDEVQEPIRSFFTFRPGQPLYTGGPGRPNQWGWLEIFPQNGYVKTDSGGFEQVTVGVAQNATEKLWPASMNSTDEVLGRGYTKKDGPNHSQDAIDRGLNFQEQWERAHKLDPELVFVTGWNEWIAGRHEKWQGTTNAFPDQFNDEYSRDIEPVRGRLADNYYHQLIANVRRFKGVEPAPLSSGKTEIKIDGRFDDWNDVRPEYRDHKGDTMHRNHSGYGKKIVYTNTTGRNDLTTAKVARDADDNLFFYVQTAKPITSLKQTGTGWMTLYIDLDRDKKTGWEGYDLIVNRVEPKREKAQPDKRSDSLALPFEATVECTDNGQSWQPVGQATLNFADNKLELKIPRVLLREKDFPLDIEFKWSDNSRPGGQITRFYTDGDAAPEGRFNFIYGQ
jgi:hypothetical protein